MTTTDYDLVIIGAGPAGLTAGIYAARARMNVLLLEKAVPGGQVLVTDWVENYPGFPEGISGYGPRSHCREHGSRGCRPAGSTFSSLTSPAEIAWT